LRHRFETCFFLTFGPHLEESFSFFGKTVLLRTKDTVSLLDQETLDFIPHANLNPVDYTVWSVLQGRVYHTKISDVDELKRRINSEWAALSHRIGKCVDTIYLIALVLETDIFTRCNNDDVTCVTF